MVLSLSSNFSQIWAFQASIASMVLVLLPSAPGPLFLASLPWFLFRCSVNKTQFNSFMPFFLALIISSFFAVQVISVRSVALAWDSWIGLGFSPAGCWRLAFPFDVIKHVCWTWVWGFSSLFAFFTLQDRHIFFLSLFFCFVLLFLIASA